MIGSGDVPEARRRVEEAAARVGVHTGLFQVRAAAVVREMLNDELGPDAAAGAADVALLAEAVSTGLAMRATKPRVTPAAFAEYVSRLAAAGAMSDRDARWALTTWVAAASGGEVDPALLAVPPPPKGTRIPAAGSLVAGAAPSPPRHARTPALLVVAAVVLVGLGTLVVLGLANRSDDGAEPAKDEVAGRWDGVGPAKPGPFTTGAAYIDALAVPKTFTRLSPDRASEFADAEFVATTDFDTTCADLARSLQSVEPTFPSPVPVEYPTGGVARCEAEAPVDALGGVAVRALVLKIDNRVQIYIDDGVAAAPDPAPPTSPP